MLLISTNACKKPTDGPPPCYFDWYYGPEVYANGSYKNLEDYGIGFAFNECRYVDTITDTSYKDSTKLSMSIVKGNCFGWHNYISFSNLKLTKHNDTIKLLDQSKLFNTNELSLLPNAVIRYIDYDAIIESYYVDDAADNWILIDSVNADTTEIVGQFNLSLITNHEVYLSGERERWDDPNRPDTLHYTNGVFRAEATFQ